MSIYHIKSGKISPVLTTTFSKEKLRERQNLQNMLKTQISVIAPDTLVVAEEFSGWEGSRRSIDLLGLDKNANLIVIELKRTEDGNHMELQALRYASMISTLTFTELVEVYQSYLDKNNISQNAIENLLTFLEWNEPDDDQFAQEVKIILASAGFSKELTTSVMWLNDYGLDIRCVRMQPYNHDGEVLLDVQTVIPIPEVADYQIRTRKKKQKERESRGVRDTTKYDVSVNGHTVKKQSKRGMLFHIIFNILQNNGTLEKIIEAIPIRKNNLFIKLDGTLKADEFREKLIAKFTRDKARRYFIKDGELFHFEGKTYALTDQWGSESVDAAESLAKFFPHLSIEFCPTKPDV